MQKQTNAKSKYFELAIPGYSPYKELYVSKILYQFFDFMGENVKIF
jgi:hypothetical protein